MTISRPQVRLVLLIGAAILLRLLLGGAIHATEDEAYYRLWAASPQLGYFDHPPMIAWWIAAGIKLAGDTALGLRLLPILGCAATTILVYDLARQLDADDATALRAALWYNATLLVGLGGILATPDSAATLFWTATACCLTRATRTDAARWWIAAGLAAGLACLSKYSALFIAPGVVAWLVWRRGPAALLRPTPWLAVVAAAVVFSPNVIWNAHHGWGSFVKQFGRVAPSHLAPQHLVELAVTQFLLLNPLVAVFAFVGGTAAWKASRRLGGHPVDLLFALSAPFAAYLALHSLHDRVQAHWPAPLYPAIAILAALGAGQVSGGALGALRRWVAPAGLGLAGLALAHMALPVSDWLGFRDPVMAVRGWPAFAAQVETVRVEQGAAWVGALSFGTTAQLQADRKIGAPVVQVSERTRYPDADSSWKAPVNRPGILVDVPRRMVIADLRQCFAKVEPVGEISRGGAPGTGVDYVIFRVEGPRADLLQNGCWSTKTPFDDLARAEAAKR